MNLEMYIYDMFLYLVTEKNKIFFKSVTSRSEDVQPNFDESLPLYNIKKTLYVMHNVKEIADKPCKMDVNR